MIQTDNPSKCCGCLACSMVCPQKCIEPTEDVVGFVMLIKKVRLTVCNLCSGRKK